MDRTPGTLKWFERITGRIVGVHAGMITLTAAPDGTHTVWFYDHQLASGPAPAMRNVFADHMRGHWLEWIYRN